MLQELVAYSETHLSESEPGFKSREVRWIVELAADGRFLNVVPLGDGQRGKTLTRCPDMHGMNAGGKAHFLVETAQTAVQLFKANEDPKKMATAEVRHHFFTRLIREASRSIPRLEALARLLEHTARLAEVRTVLAKHKARPGDWMVWRIGNYDPREDGEVQAWWRAWRRADQGNGPTLDLGNTPADDGTMICFLTGVPVKPLATHPKITGLSGVGGLAMGDVMVGFDKAAFGSYGLDQSANAAMGEESVQKYVDGLNDLIRNHARKLADTLVAHWYKDTIQPEDDPLAFLMGMQTQEQTEATARASVRRLLDAIRTGQRAELRSGPGNSDRRISGSSALMGA